ncbi:MAG: exodeoxyribonuclease V subunit beta [Nocardioides sp.]|nr:exodeoxyribonuclease V subunit beta [Nocardioides sp.]
MQPFDLLGSLPTGATTTVLEASAGTGKTYTLAGLVARYVAEGVASLDEMLLITFGRAATEELRARVRDQLVEVGEALDDVVLGAAGTRRTDRGEPDALVRHLCNGDPAEVARRRDRVRDALAGFDAATIATTHGFCQVVLRSLGVAGDSETGLTLAESLDDLLAEVVDDLYLARFGAMADRPPLTRAEALGLARSVVANPRARLTPEDPAPGSPAAVRRELADAVLAEMEHRKRRLGVLGFDDLLGRLATDLDRAGSPARTRMRERWRVVMVDEFQDTDPTQWEIIERAFVGHATVVLIGDPKQAIYAFRGGDIATYLSAASAADQRLTLGTNWRSDEALVERVQAVLGGAALGHEDIVVRPVDTHWKGHRLTGAGERQEPFRLRVVPRTPFGVSDRRTVKIDDLRPWIADDLARDVRALLASGAEIDGRRVRAGDLAVIVEAHKDARACREALTAAGVPAVYTGDADVFASQAAADWLCLLEACEQPHRSGLVRAAAATMFFGHDHAAIAAGGDELTDAVAATLRRWADHVRERGPAAVVEAARASGVAERVLGWQGGERDLTDLEHVGQLLHEVAHRERLGVPALRDWLREQTEEGRSGAAGRYRRLDSDAEAVQVMTVWVSKGLQFPVVYLPFAFNRHVRDADEVLFHDEDGRRCLDVGGKRSGGEWTAISRRGRQESAADDVRLTYVALTRAQSQVVAWWAPSWDERSGGLSRLLRGRVPRQADVPDQLDDAPPPDDDALALFRRWEGVRGAAVEIAEHAPLADDVPDEPLAVVPQRVLDRGVDTAWQRTSYSRLVRPDEQASGTRSEPDLALLDDEGDDAAGPVEAADGADAEGAAAALVSPMALLPAGATFGSLVHAVLEHADPEAPDLAAEVEAHVREQLVWWPVDAEVDDLVAGILPVLGSPLGPAAPGLTLNDVPLRDRLRELDFELPLSGGDRERRADVVLADVGSLLRRTLEPDDPMLAYADRLEGEELGPRPLRGYLAGSIDVVLRVLGEDGERFVVVDYKTNRLVPADVTPTTADFGPAELVEAMLHSDYPLQALLYSAVLHRYLRWRLRGYDPARHLGGIVYLYLRGMAGPDTPVVDGHPAGVFTWQPPVATVTALSDLLDGAEVIA